MANKDLGEGLEQFEEEVEGLKNKEFRLFGIKMTAMTVSAAFAVISAGVGSLYGAFEVYKDYMAMKDQIQSYVAPDLSGIDKKLAVASEQATKAVEYTRDINQNLKADIRRLESMFETLERDNKVARRELDTDLKIARKSIDQATKNVDEMVRNVNKDITRLEKETANELKSIRNELDVKIKQALDNPLAN